MMKNPFYANFAQSLLNTERSCIDTWMFTKNESFIWNQCPKEFATRHYLYLHIKNVHNLICPHCGQAYHTSCALSSLIGYKHDGGSNEGSICERKLKNNYSLKRHLSSHEEKAHNCSICNKNFKNLKEHSNYCTKE